jgi:hypothetical protein
MNINDKVVIKDLGVFGVIAGVIYDNGKTTLIVRENLTDNEYECKYRDVISKKDYKQMVQNNIENEITENVRNTTDFIKGGR